MKPKDCPGISMMVILMLRKDKLSLSKTSPRIQKDNQLALLLDHLMSFWSHILQPCWFWPAEMSNIQRGVFYDTNWHRGRGREKKSLLDQTSGTSAFLWPLNVSYKLRPRAVNLVTVKLIKHQTHAVCKLSSNEAHEMSCAAVQAGQQASLPPTPAG